MPSEKRTSALLVSRLMLALVAMSGPAAAQQHDHPLNINVTLTPPAAEKMKGTSEEITVSAVWSGTPNHKGRSQVDESGSVPLATEDVTGNTGGLLSLSGRLPAERLELIQGPPQVNVNVYSARKTSDDNILSCDVIDGPAEPLSGKIIPILCSLITENREPNFLP